ncbi:MAG: ABC transporter permease [Myxococcaceae bacterium]|nr:ABC transporter permease [Myxococcaceae bacterium]
MLVRVCRLLPSMDRRELLRSIAHFGFGSLPLTIVVATVTGATVVLQTSLYVERFGARQMLGWAAGYAVLWEFGPLLLGLMLVARVGARNAAELAQLSVGGQLEGLAGISLDPLALLVAPRVWGVLMSVVFLALPAFVIATLWEIAAAFFTLQIPVRVFLGTFQEMLGTGELLGGLVKSVAFAGAIALVSTLAGIRARGGARAVGRAAASAVVYGAAAIFALDFSLSSLLSRLAHAAAG